MTTKWTPIVPPNRSTSTQSDKDTLNTDFEDENDFQQQDDDFDDGQNDMDSDDFADVDFTSEDDSADDDLDFNDQDEDDDDYQDDKSSRAKQVDKKKTSDKSDDGKKRESRAQERIRKLNEEKRQLEAQLIKERQERSALQNQSRTSELNSITSDISSINSTLRDAKRSLREAMENNDPDAAAEAQAAITNCQIDLRVAEANKARIEKDVETSKETQRESAETERTSKTPSKKLPRPLLDWKERNDTWFDKDYELTGLAFGINQKLLEEGYDASSDEFYEELDNRMSRYLPSDEDKKSDTRKAGNRQKLVRKQSPVGESSRTSPKATNYTATARDKETARRLNVDPNAYVRQKALYDKHAADENRTYKPIILPTKNK